MNPIIDCGIESELELIDLLTHPGFLIFIVFLLLFLNVIIEHWLNKCKKKTKR